MGRALVAAATVAVVWASAGCGTMRGAEALREVDFTVERVRDVRLAGVLVDGGRLPDLPPEEQARLAATALAGRLPLECEVIVRASNPASNPVTAELLRMEWSLLVDGRSALGGQVDRRYAIPPGASVDVPVHVSADLFDVVGRRLSTLLRLAAALAGDEKSPVDIRLRLVPILDTPFGSMRMPHGITIPLDALVR